ncbi:MAG: phosphoribosyltransferase, partial [Clostridia bacterium]|nr:phosphoribosyltransferase [Clostridia bacterium]
SSKNVILIDDVVTTGASIGYMATLLKGCGAKNIVAASLAMSYRDKSTHFDTNDRFSPK